MNMTSLFSLIKSKENLALFAKILSETITGNNRLRNSLKYHIDNGKVSDFLNELFTRKPSVLLIMDSERKELQAFVETYTDTWGKMLKPMVMSKFSFNGDNLYTVNPDFSDIDKGKTKEEVIKSTEEDHMKDVSDTVKEIYTSIKTELLKADAQVEFNPKRFYISIRKKKNLAFANIGKKKISLVVVNPEEETRKVIKHHEIKTLTEKVQKFWNGSSCTIIIENLEKLHEVIALLKKLVKAQGD